MSDTLIYLLILAGGLIVGVGIGALLTRRQYSQPAGSAQALSELQQLKIHAAAQFTDTAALISELEKNQLRLREQLTVAAKQVANLDFNDLLLADTQRGAKLLTPPLDYATQRGALSETYGLQDDREIVAAELPVISGHAYDLPSEK